tara:strand:- start:525 stop:677 length:153 start_codon:yes stop_codon:yes gene_type:complete
MPDVGGKKFSYSKKGKAEAKAYAKRTGKKMTKKKTKTKKYNIAKNLGGGY